MSIHNVATSEGDFSVDEALRKLKESVFALPLPALTDEIRKELGLGDGTMETAVARRNGDKAIDELNYECGLGNHEAFTHLAALALRINAILIQFGGDPTTKVGDENPASNLGYVDENAVAAFEAKIADSIENLRSHPTAALRRRLDIEKNANAAIYPCAKLARLKGGANDPPFIGDGLPCESESEALITEILQHCVGQRLLAESRIAVRQVAADSFVWPVSIPAFAEERDEVYAGFISKLPVGANLPYRAQKKTKSGRGRVFNSDSATGFTARIFTALAIERSKFLRGILPGRKVSPVTHDGTNQWRELAGRLELLQSPSLEQSEQWVDAGLALCEAECGGNWELYRSFDCVRTRAETKVYQGVRASVREVLAAGEKELRHTESRQNAASPPDGNSSGGPAV